MTQQSLNSQPTGPSKFSIKSYATNQEIWYEILNTLPEEDRAQADKSQSDFNEPYMGGKEIIVRRKDRSDLAYASLSEKKEKEDEWAVYREE